MNEAKSIHDSIYWFHHESSIVISFLEHLDYSPESKIKIPFVIQMSNWCKINYWSLIKKEEFSFLIEIVLIIHIQEYLRV